MRIFVTGASGFVGSAVVESLLSAGHSVLGLTRSRAIHPAATALVGDINDAAVLERAVGETDGVIHTAFNHDFTRFKASCEEDRRVVELLTASAGEKPVVITSAIGVLKSPAAGTLLGETARPPADGPNPRIATEQAVEAALQRGANVAVVRLPPSTHGAGDAIGFVPTLIRIARATGISAYLADGENRWPAVHRLDAAELYRLAVERGHEQRHAGVEAAYFHAVGDEGVRLRDIATIIGRRLSLPVVAKPKDEAAAHFGAFAHFASLDVAASSAVTQAALGWRPTHVDLLTDIASASYLA